MSRIPILPCAAGLRLPRPRDRPIIVAFLSFVCTCALVGGTLRIFEDQHPTLPVPGRGVALVSGLV